MKMVTSLPTPEVVRSYFDDGFTPALPAMSLRWQGIEKLERLWDLPEGVSVFGPPPQRFGISVRRRAANTYAVRVLWDTTCLSWTALTRTEILSCSLAALLNALGTDPWCVLEQPVRAEAATARRAA